MMKENEEICGGRALQSNSRTDCIARPLPAASRRNSRLTTGATLLLAIASVWLVTVAGAAAATFSIGDSDFLLDGKPLLIKAGEMHPARIPHEYWAERLRTMHAMGLNTVSIYVFWNQHEPREGEFNFSGDADVARFVRLAQKEGLWVILRPGPYCCAEWEFGGLPWWLLKTRDIKVRTQDPRFLEAAGKYLKKLGEQLAPLQVTRGGPIIMLQVENEYGSYAGDHIYMGKIRDLDRAAGFDVPLFTADGGGQMMANGSLPDVLPGLNGGGGRSIMTEIGKYRAQGPWFVPEFYPGWLDNWGSPHAHVGIEGLARETEWKLTNNVSFCYYMVYGGTTFGFMNGANMGGQFQPQPTSYDYDAPINEMGAPTKKFLALREVLARHLAPGEKLPDVPAAAPVIEIPRIELTQTAGILDNPGRPVKAERPLSFEDLDQGYGYVLYRTTITGPIESNLKIKDVRDFAVVCVDGKRVATLDRRHNQSSTPITVSGAQAQLDVLVENCGRINYGRQMNNNRKGITEGVWLGDKELTGWEMYRLPFTDVSKLKFKSFAAVTAPAVHSGTFELAAVGDTFLDMRGWGKGIVILNGNNLGRYWRIGPQQTLYVPGVWLKRGRNEIAVFEQIKDDVGNLCAVKEPILDQLNAEEIASHRPAMKEPKLRAENLVKEGSLEAGTAAQTITFAPKQARFVCLEAVSSQNGDEYTTLAELDALDAAGTPIPREGWKVVYVDSEETMSEDGQAENIFDANAETFWHTLWSAPHTSHPHKLVIDLGSARAISGIRLLPRQSSPNGRIKGYRVYLSEAAF